MLSNSAQNHDYYISDIKEPDYLEAPRLLRYRDGGFFAPETREYWKISFCDGPKRVSEGGGSTKDYYSVYTTNEERLWIYFDSEDKNFYLEGYLE